MVSLLICSWDLLAFLGFDLCPRWVVRRIRAGSDAVVGIFGFGGALLSDEHAHAIRAHYEAWEQYDCPAILLQTRCAS